MYEVYREKFTITEIRDGCVYKTKSLGCGWFDEMEVKQARTLKVGDIGYAAATDEFARNNCTIRKKRNQPHHEAPDNNKSMRQSPS